MTKIVVKVGTNVLTDEEGKLDNKIIANLVEQISTIKRQKIDIALITSGAVGAGKKRYEQEDSVKKRGLLSKEKIVQKQVFASLGQIKLMETYSKYFLKHKFFCAQVLATREDFRDRKHYLNMRNCLQELLSNHIVPIINENDVISIQELMFSDNDELAAMVSSMINAQKLILLTNVDGLYDGDPDDPDSKLITEVKVNEKWEKYVCEKKSSLGRGGMSTKCKIGQRLGKMGIETILVNGKQKDVLLKVIKGDFRGTTFMASKKVSAVKKWIAVAPDIKRGAIVVNDGAKEAILDGASLLPVGIVDIEGYFEEGSTVYVKGEDGKVFAGGLVRMNSKQAKTKIGQSNQSPLIRRDYIFLY